MNPLSLFIAYHTGVAGDVADVAGVATAVAVAVAAAFAVVAATAAVGLAAVPSRQFGFGSDLSKESAKKRKLQIQIFFQKVSGSLI